MLRQTLQRIDLLPHAWGVPVCRELRNLGHRRIRMQKVYELQTELLLGSGGSAAVPVLPVWPHRSCRENHGIHEQQKPMQKA